MYDVKGSRAIITGSAQGLGKEFAKRLLQDGCKVCLSDVDEVKGLETKLQFQKQFGLGDDGVCFVKCDVTIKDDWIALWESAEKFLNGPIDILINNAGLFPAHGWEKNISVMLMGHVQGIFMAIAKMGRSNGGRGGRIINVASAAGIAPHGLGDINCAGYCVSKHGMVSMTRSFITSDPKPYDTDGIKCYALCPVFVDTNLVREGLKAKSPSREALGGKPAGNIEELAKATKMRVMTVNEIGDAMKKSLQYDKVFVDTNLVREGLKAKEHKSRQRLGGKPAGNIEELATATKMRVMTVNEIGDAMKKSLQYDKDGAVYAILPDMPLIEWPDDESARFMSIVMANMMVGSRLNIELFTAKHYYAIVLICLFLFFYISTTILGWLF